MRSCPGLGVKEVNLYLFHVCGDKSQENGDSANKGREENGEDFLRPGSPSRGIKEFSGQQGPLMLCGPGPLIGF